jgi:hypothetical protein
VGAHPSFPRISQAFSVDLQLRKQCHLARFADKKGIGDKLSNRWLDSK